MIIVNGWGPCAAAPIASGRAWVVTGRREAYDRIISYFRFRSLLAPVVLATLRFRHTDRPSSVYRVPTAQVTPSLIFYFSVKSRHSSDEYSTKVLKYPTQVLNDNGCTPALHWRCSVHLLT